MPKNTSRRSDLKRIAIFTLILFSFVFTSYFLVLLLPKTLSVNKISAAKSDLEISRLNLSQNKVLFYSFLSLDPISITFPQDKVELLTQLQKANQNALEHFNGPPERVSAGILVNKNTKKLITEINKELPSVYSKSAESLQKQQQVIEEISETSKLFGKLPDYSPALDLSDLNNIDKTLDRAETASIEIVKIKDIIDRSELNNKEDLSKEINAVLAALNAFKTTLGSSNANLSATRLQSLENAYNKLKSTLYEEEISIIKSETSLTALATQNEALSKLESFINEASLVQTELTKDPLYNFLKLFSI